MYCFFIFVVFVRIYFMKYVYYIFDILVGGIKDFWFWSLEDKVFELDKG